jgi:hypothetical protein
MTPLSATAEQPEAPLFTDGLGDRVVAVDAATGDLLQILRIRPQLLAVPSFEFALRERAARLANFRHAYYGRVRRIDRHPAGLAIVSDHVEGVRLSEMLRVAAERRLPLDLNAALCLLRQLVPSLALLHENARDVAHGLIGPERLIVTPRARLVVVEHVLGSAVEQLQFNRERLWQELRVALPPAVGIGRFDHRADVTAMGLVALALVLGRPISPDEYPQKAGQLLAEARARTAGAPDQPLPHALHLWIARALQLDPRQGFTSATEAQVALEDALAESAEFVAAPVALETFLSRYITAMLDPVVPAATAPPAAIPVVQSQVRPAVPVAPLPIEQLDAVPLPPPVVKLEAPVFVAPPVAPAIVSAPPVVVAPLAATPLVVEPVAVEAPATSARVTPDPAPLIAAPARDINELLKDFDMPDEPAHLGKPQAAAAPSGPRGKAPWMRIAVAGVVVAALGGGGYYASRTMKKAAPPALGSLAVQTNPAGVAVFVDGVARGNTPARLSLNAGSHIVELRGRGVPRVLPVTITAGAEVSQYLELPETPSAGSLLVQSDPAGARVSVDGVEHGRAPVSVADLTPGEHEVVLQAEGGPAVKQKVVIQAGVTSSVLAPVTTAAPGPVSGWLTVKSPVSLEIRENNRLLGTSESDRIMLAAGRHEVQFMNDTLGYDETRVITVQPGKVAPISIQMPQGVININASPWAEVWIDNRRAGETPIGNLPVSIGPHEVVFRHPQLGEKRQAVSVTLKAPVRLSVDMK